MSHSPGIRNLPAASIRRPAASRPLEAAAIVAIRPPLMVTVIPGRVEPVRTSTTATLVRTRVESAAATPCPSTESTKKVSILIPASVDSFER